MALYETDLTLPIERYIVQLLEEVPFPSPSIHLQVNKQ